MKTRPKNLWVRALRSGKYKQTQSNLQTEDGFCCLGVLCDLYAQETGNGEWVDANYARAKMFKYKTKGRKVAFETIFLPAEVSEWAGIEGDTSVPIPKVFRGARSLMEANDSRGLSFKSIANIIEKQL